MQGRRMKTVLSAKFQAIQWISEARGLSKVFLRKKKGNGKLIVWVFNIPVLFILQTNGNLVVCK